jgi:AcrR family transcriptional regulator
MSQSLKQPRKRQDTATDILDIAERLFGQLGFQKTTVADIARELEMSPANIYRYFAAKADINEAVVRNVFDKVEAMLDGIVVQKAPATEKLRAFIEAIERENANRFLENRKIHELVETSFDEKWSVLEKHVRNLDGSLAKIIAQGNAEGRYHVDDCELAAILVRSACLRFCHPRLMVECSQDPEPTIDHMIEFCLVALGGGAAGNYSQCHSRNL